LIARRVVIVATNARAALERLVHAQERLLDHVLGLGDGAQHPVGDRERRGPQVVEQLLALGHAVLLGRGLIRT
jgi:hypothetical protein